MTSRPDIPELGAAVKALRWFTVAVGVVTFALSFVGLYDYGRHVIRLSAWLAWLVPVGIDCLTLAAVAATFALRQAPKHVRLYAWCVFIVALAASVAGNLSHAVRRDLPLDGRIGAAAWPALLALASHLVVVTWRHLERQPSVASTSAARRVAAAAEPTRQTVVSLGKSRPAPDKKAAALELIADGMTQGEAAKKVGKSERTVARWVADAKKQSTPAITTVLVT